MKIVPNALGHIDELAVLINAHVKSIPPYFSFSRRRVENLLFEEGAWYFHYPEDKYLGELEVLCAEERGRLIGALQWHRPDVKDPEINERNRNRASLCWVIAAKERGHTVEKLLDVFHERAKGQGCTSVFAATRCELGVTWFGFPVTWRYVIDALQRKSYACEDRWVMMTGPTDSTREIVEPDIPGLQLEWTINKSRLEWDVRAMVDGKEAGNCSVWGIPPCYADCAGYKDWTTLESVDVEEEYRRKGLARYLIQSQFSRQRKLGVKQVIAQTEVNNEPARKFFETLGFKFGPECWCFERTL